MTATSDNLSAKLVRMSHFSTPPADVVADVLAAYEARIADLEAEVAKKDARIGEEVSFQRVIREGEQQARHEMAKRHQDEKRTLIKEIGFAAVIRDRVLNAHWQGRKTVKVDALLKGRPEVTA